MNNSFRAGSFRSTRSKRDLHDLALAPHADILGISSPMIVLVSACQNQRYMRPTIYLFRYGKNDMTITAS